MKNLSNDLKIIYQNERGVIFLMIMNFIIAMVLLVFAIANLSPNAAVVKIGYGDIGGYRDGAWTNMLIFPLLAILFGFLHSILALKVFRKRGGGMAKFFLMVTTMLILGSFVVLVRLLGES